ncbi:MAG: hypothetical protein ABII20_06725 [Candidatus Omnitrophota bacterium]|nr:hypothetical protein [Candidatus Omnitrophota bacterium]MBA3066159.1 hypothetical protein [bacterium]MBU2529263.1 hypothetical protein [bacterium]MBU3930234.1 hypothetical protein [bacterium]MBU4122100.1 hypothetical protein [bacterium]
MKFREFIQIYKDAVLIDGSTFSVFDKAQNLRRQVSDWLKKGYLIQLKKGTYIFSDEYRKINPSISFIANFLYSPSYLSLEYALSFYGLIPEKVTVITSVSARKTKTIKNRMGRFEYNSIKKELFFGFKKSGTDGQNFFIAEPEKALLDFFYLRTEFKGSEAELKSLRLQNSEIVDQQRLGLYSLKYNKRVRKISKALIEFIKSEEKYKTI